MGLPRQLVAQIRRLDEGQLRQLLILARGLLVTAEDPVIEIEDLPGMPTIRYRQKTVRCGKAACTSCPHGPYWYAHWTEDGRRRSRYIGSELPADVRRKLEALDRELAEREGADVAADADAAVAASGDAGAQPRSSARGLRLITE